MKGNTKGVFETYTHFRVRDLVRSEPRLEYIDLRVSRNPYHKQPKFNLVEGKRPSIDRINSNKGYTKDNVVITLGVINLMKRDLELNEFIELCSQVANHFNNK